MESCRFCGKPLVEEPGAESWPAQGWCRAECAFRFYAFNRPTKEAQVEERNRSMEEIIQGYRESLVIPRGEQEEPGETVEPPEKTRLVLEVFDNIFQYAYCNHGPIEILIADHGIEDGAEGMIYLPRGKHPGPLVNAEIFGPMEIKLDPAFVAETFRRAEES
jgi:hypothetical protein